MLRSVPSHPALETPAPKRELTLLEGLRAVPPGSPGAIR